MRRSSPQQNNCPSLPARATSNEFPLYLGKLLQKVAAEEISLVTDSSSRATVLVGTGEISLGCAGTSPQSSSLFNFKNKLRSPPSNVMPSAPRHFRNTPPSGVSKEKKFGRRNRLVRPGCFFSSASEYRPKKRSAISSLFSRKRVRSRSRFVRFSS